MKRSILGVLALLALLLRLPLLYFPASRLPVAAPLGPLPVWLQPWLDAQPWGWTALGLLGALMDAAAVLLLAHLVQRRGLAERLLSPQRQPEGWATPGAWAGLAWAVHPVSLYLGGSAGAWQSAALACLLWSAWDLEYSVHPAAEGRAAWSFGLAISLALWPLLLLPLGAAGLLSRRERIRFYLRALLLPALLALPWLLMKTPDAVLQACLGGPSILGPAGVLKGLWSAAGAPQPLLQGLLRAWHWSALGALLGFWAWSFWRPAALLPGLAVSAWTWALFCPGLQAPLLLAPLALALLLPGRLAWRLAAATLPLLLLQDHVPALRGLLLQPGAAGPGQALHLLWAALCLAWLFWVGLEWSRLWSYATRPQGPSSLR